jgi:hypothetical protein
MKWKPHSGGRKEAHPEGWPTILLLCSWARNPGRRARRTRRWHLGDHPRNRRRHDHGQRRDRARSALRPGLRRSVGLVAQVGDHGACTGTRSSKRRHPWLNSLRPPPSDDSAPRGPDHPNRFEQSTASHYQQSLFAIARSRTPISTAAELSLSVPSARLTQSFSSPRPHSRDPEAIEHSFVGGTEQVYGRGGRSLTQPT